LLGHGAGPSVAGLDPVCATLDTRDRRTVSGKT